MHSDFGSCSSPVYPVLPLGDRVQGLASPSGHASRRVRAGSLRRDFHRTYLALSHPQLHRLASADSIVRRF